MTKEIIPIKKKKKYATVRQTVEFEYQTCMEITTKKESKEFWYIGRRLDEFLPIDRIPIHFALRKPILGLASKGDLLASLSISEEQVKIYIYELKKERNVLLLKNIIINPNSIELKKKIRETKTYILTEEHSNDGFYFFNPFKKYNTFYGRKNGRVKDCNIINWHDSSSEGVTKPHESQNISWELVNKDETCMGE